MTIDSHSNDIPDEVASRAISRNGGRLLSLDALRGFDMIWIMGLARVFRGWCTLFSGGKDFALYHQMCHVQWEGLAFYDTIFPLFIFIAGVSWPFSYAHQCAKGVSTRSVYFKIFRRLATLLALGMVYNGILQLDFHDFRYASVLGKIGLAWALAAVIYINTGFKSRLAALLALLAGYWALLQFTAPDAPAGAGPFTLDGCMPGYLDRLGFTPGYLYCDNKLEPSGVVVSALGSTASALLGMFAGDLVRLEKSGFTPARKAGALALIGLALGLAGWALSFDTPIIKNLWTPSFTLVCGAVSFVLFALFYYVIDVKGRSKWSMPLQVVGVNAIAAYMMQAFIDFKKTSAFFFGGLASFFPSPDFINGVGYTLLCWCTLYFLYRKKVFIKC